MAAPAREKEKCLYNVHNVVASRAESGQQPGWPISVEQAVTSSPRALGF